jgi:predicted secreted protein
MVPVVFQTEGGIEMKKNQYIVMMVLALTLVCGTAAAEGMAYREYQIGTTVIIAGDCSESAAESIDVKRGEYIKVILYAAGGTGYEWVVTDKNLSMVEVVNNSVAPVDSSTKLVGGKARWTFYLKMRDDASGQEVVPFALKRAWEKNEPPARKFELTVVARSSNP